MNRRNQFYELVGPEDKRPKVKCPFCQTDLGAEEAAKLCPKCGKLLYVFKPKGHLGYKARTER